MTVIFTALPCSAGPGRHPPAASADGCRLAVSRRPVFPTLGIGQGVHQLLVPGEVLGQLVTEGASRSWLTCHMNASAATVRTSAARVAAGLEDEALFPHPVQVVRDRGGAGEANGCG